MAEHKMRKKIAILGSTGSIGTQALEVIDKLSDKFEIIAFSAGNNIQLLKEQMKKYSPKYVSVKNETDTIELKKEFTNIKILY